MIEVNNNIVFLNSTWPVGEDTSEFENAINSLINDGHSEILIDLSLPEYLPSETIGFIMWKKRELTKENKDLKIIKISDQLLDLFKQTQILNFLGIDENINE